jgi:hypothetical protein
MMYLFVGVVYLYISINCLESSDKIDPPEVDGEPVAKCNIDSN